MWAKRYVYVMPFLEVKITWCVSSKQEWKNHQNLLQRLELSRNKKVNEEKEHIFLWYTWILIIMHDFNLWQTSVSPTNLFSNAPLCSHLLSSVFSNPASFQVCLCAFMSWVVHFLTQLSFRALLSPRLLSNLFLTLPPFKCAFKPLSLR